MCPTRAASCPPAWRRPTGACPGTPNGAPAVAALPTTLGQPLLRLSAQLHRAFHAMSHRACLLRIMTLTRGVFLWRQGARCAGSEAACGRLGARRSWPARGCCGRGGACGGGARRQRRRARSTRRRVRFPLSFSLETEAPTAAFANALFSSPRARERRELAESLRGQKTLADDDAAGDDAGAWIERSRKLAAAKAEAARRDAAKAAAARRAAALDEQDEGGSDEDEAGRPLYTAKDLAGLKARPLSSAF